MISSPTSRSMCPLAGRSSSGSVFDVAAPIQTRDGRMAACHPPAAASRGCLVSGGNGRGTASTRSDLLLLRSVTRGSPGRDVGAMTSGRRHRVKARIRWIGEYPAFSVEIAKIAAVPAVDRITYLGHATLLIELGSARLLTDPILRSGFAHVRRQAPAIDVAALGRPDAVLVSHLHHDHLDLPSLKRLGRVAPLVVPRGAGAFLRSHGFAHITELAPGDEARAGAALITATRADHDDHRFGTRLRAEPLGFVVAGSGRRVYFAGDTDLFGGMAELADPPLD